MVFPGSSSVLDKLQSATVCIYCDSVPLLDFWTKQKTSKKSLCKCVCASCFSEAWGPPQFQEKRSRSEKAILGALGEFRGILGATLGIRNSILGIRNSILGMASHDLTNTKTAILGATPGAIPRIDGNPHERFSFAPSFSERFFENWGGPRAQEFLYKGGRAACSPTLSNC